MRLSLLFSLALGSVLGCARQPAEEYASVTVQAPLSVAPVAETHPWVMALLTSVTVSKPNGIYTRLHGRMDPDGHEVMDPWIYTHDKRLLVDYLRRYEQVHARPGNLAPVWELHPSPSSPEPTWQLHFIDQHAGFRVDGATATTVWQGATPVVELTFSPAQRELFTALTRAAVHRRIAFSIGDDVVSCPIVREPIPNGQVRLRDNSGGDPEVLTPALLARLHQPG